MSYYPLGRVSDTILAKAKQIKWVIFDVDGVLTNGDLYFDGQGEAMKTFNSKDGHGIRQLQDGGIQVALITGRQSALLLHRADNLGISRDQVYQNYRDKRPAFQDFLKRNDLSASQIAYLGDDVIDLPVMSAVGLPCAVSDAHPFVTENAIWISEYAGGAGAVRELCDLLLAAQGKLEAVHQAYLQS